MFELDKEKGGEGEDGDGGQGAKGGEDEEEEDESESDDDDVQIHIGPIETQAAPFYPGRLPSTSSEYILDSLVLRPLVYVIHVHSRYSSDSPEEGGC